MTVSADLRRAEAAYREAVKRAERLRAIRNEIVANALREGMTHQQIADATGLSRGRISQLHRPAEILSR
ncbi:MAG: sigma factor-like helix-turn-helix DNA-binding protein [Solirubrobacteraceae bacterium]|jgi:DNA-directed RNA polymerase specialized sigma subunit